MGQTATLAAYAVRWVLTVVLAFAAAWVFGLVLFLAQVQLQRVPATLKADGIVVLTGGEGRVAEGLKLLADMKGTAMLISGVHPEATKDSITKAQNITDARQQSLLQCCVDLGYTAGSTVGNAEEAATWARTKKLASLIVVTAAYHIPRSRLEFVQALPNVKLVYYPLARENVPLDVGGVKWWRAPVEFVQQFPGTAQLMAWEYTKYLFALGRAIIRYTA